MKTIIGYIRISTDGQRDWFGLDVQRSAIEKYTKENNMELVKVFSENGVSGSLEDRPALSEMFEYIKNNRVDGVVFLRLDRLARDLLIQENLLAEFQKLGVKPISVDEPDLLSSEPSRVVFRQLKWVIAQYEKSMITLRLSSGRRKKVEMGKWHAGGNLPFGFRIENERYVPVDEEVVVLKEIFRLRRKPRNGKRMSFRKLSEVLNEKYWEMRKFSAWGVFYIVNNPFYKWFQRYGGISYRHQDIADFHLAN